MDKDEIYVFLGFVMLMRIVQKLYIKSYFSKNPLLNTTVFDQTISQDHFELIFKFLYYNVNFLDSVKSINKMY